MPHDVGSGDWFFKSVSHQLYGTADLLFQIRLSGIGHLNNHPELYVKSIVDDTQGKLCKINVKCRHMV